MQTVSSGVQRVTSVCEGTQPRAGNVCSDTVAGRSVDGVDTRLGLSAVVEGIAGRECCFDKQRTRCCACRDTEITGRREGQDRQVKVPIYPTGMRVVVGGIA